MPLSSRASPTQSRPWVHYAGAIPSRTAAGHPALSTPRVSDRPLVVLAKILSGRLRSDWLTVSCTSSLAFVGVRAHALQSSARDVRSVACCRPTCAPRVRARTASRSTSGPRVVRPRRPAPSCSSCPAAASNRYAPPHPATLPWHCEHSSHYICYSHVGRQHFASVLGRVLHDQPGRDPRHYQLPPRRTTTLRLPPATQLSRRCAIGCVCCNQSPLLYYLCRCSAIS
jgi:hypothetical protein